VTHHWLVKSNPASYSIADLQLDRRTSWDGVRNFEARNFLQKMKRGERVLFYHSSADPAGAAGVAMVARAAYPDASAFDANDDHFDPKSDPDAPTWRSVDLAFVQRFARIVSIAEIKARPALRSMMLVSRFRAPSVQPVTRAQFDRIVRAAASRA
jgi:predicted RNA-binding protein with PUA-like domain